MLVHASSTRRLLLASCIWSILSYGTLIRTPPIIIPLVLWRGFWPWTRTFFSSRSFKFHHHRSHTIPFCSLPFQLPSQLHQH
ncbi:hypothetical protein R3P38DRAFT_2931471 [Favolaschia claudopus]|uniref:Secreted protein n=1 Tax=Favolaschia claudopus TaxID=2862362 RepID=A0AAW0BSE8_9AGAR